MPWRSAAGPRRTARAADVAALAADQRVRELLQRVVDDTNRDRSRFEQIKRFAVLPRDFTMEAGEITPTLKLRRRAAQEHFADEIEALYAEPYAAAAASEEVESEA